MKTEMIERFKDASDEEVFKQAYQYFFGGFIGVSELKLKEVRRIGHEVVVCATVSYAGDELDIKVSLPRYKVVRSR